MTKRRPSRRASDGPSKKQTQRGGLAYRSREERDRQTLMRACHKQYIEGTDGVATMWAVLLLGRLAALDPAMAERLRIPVEYPPEPEDRRGCAKRIAD